MGTLLYNKNQKWTTGTGVGYQNPCYIMPIHLTLKDQFRQS